MRTRLTRLLGIEKPVLCGGLMWLADARYVAAVVNAGAMGFVTARTFPDPEAFRAELQLARDLTGGRPFGVNLHLSAREGENAIIDSHAEILLEEGVRIVETSGVPPRALMPRLQAAGATVVHKVAAVRHAVAAERMGADAVSIVGAECGGHPGMYMVGTMVQAAKTAGQLTVPFAVGGGIGHGSQLAALLAMGADAAVIGTRMLVAEEIWAHPDYKARVAAADETCSRLVLQTLRNTYRCLDNATARQVQALEQAGETDFEAYRPLVAGINQKHAYETGDAEGAILSLGQAACFADRVAPAGEILDQLMAEAATGRDRLNALDAAG